jgi:outer membrane receptor protein involved in Fe transport
VNLGTRLDYFKFNYVDLLDSTYKMQAVNKIVASPKLNILYRPNPKLQIYLKTGIGFHSNDTRVVVAESTENTLPIAIGGDLGTIWKPYKRFVLDFALWTLYSQQEMVYVGDAAIVEPSGQSLRRGADLGLHFQVLDWLFLDASLNYAHARSIDDPEGSNYIPLAVDLTSSGGISIKHPSGISGGIRYRYIKDRPANEDNSIVAKGYEVVDLNISYQYKRLGFGITIENLFNTEWNETQFATESRLRNEPISREEIHFTPGTPFFIKGQIEYRF